MIELVIEKIEPYGHFILKDKSEKKYAVILEFQIKKQPKVGDVLIINEALLNPNFQKYSPFYSFGELKSEYGREITSDNDVDLIGFFDGKEKLVLKRVYG